MMSVIDVGRGAVGTESYGHLKYLGQPHRGITIITNITIDTIL